MNKSYLLGAVCACLVVVSFNANAALVGRDFDGNLSTAEAYYDTEADLTWLADANAAGTTMTWDGANVWAAALTVDGVGGWRLPDTLQPDASCNTQDWPTPGDSTGPNCTGSEMGNLFYNVLGGAAAEDIHFTHNDNYYLFSNIQHSGTDSYWSATEFESDATPYYRAWFFIMGGGGQQFASQSEVRSAWAVQSGDVGAAVVPIPTAVSLFGSGLLGLIGIARRKK